MVSLNKDTGIAASVVAERGLQICGDLGSALAYGAPVLTGGGVAMSQRWRGLKQTIKGGSADLFAGGFTHPNQAPVMRRTVLAPYPERPPV
jgi:hypothetical protein